MLDHFRCLADIQIRLCIYKCNLVCTVILGSVSDIFGDTQASIIQEHTHAYPEPRVSLAYSEPWNIPITNHIQILRYIHNII